MQQQHRNFDDKGTSTRRFHTPRYNQLEVNDRPQQRPSVRINPINTKSKKASSEVFKNATFKNTPLPRPNPASSPLCLQEKKKKLEQPQGGVVLLNHEGQHAPPSNANKKNTHAHWERDKGHNRKWQDSQAGAMANAAIIQDANV